MPQATLESLRRLCEVSGLNPDGQDLKTVIRHTYNEPTTSVVRTDHAAHEPTLSLSGLNGLIGEAAAQTPREIDFVEEIGRGGMGIVKLGLQKDLNRQVAIKQLRDDARKEQDQERLIQEARVMGNLEHPNIVPVYWLDKDPNQHPMLVMKHVDGVSWDELLKRPDHPKMPKLDGDHLEFHLDVLMQVCRAVHFAHANHILHLDIKPENVMIGAFGEVYLLDWGIAVTTNPAIHESFPTSKGVQNIIGTPSYMAPEMANITSLSTKSDNFLLGACLYHVLAGHAPFRGNRVITVLLNVALCRYDPLPDSCPKTLADIAVKAMALRPEDRHDSAESLRLEVARYLRLRNAIKVADSAGDALEQLERFDPVTTRSSMDVRLIQNSLFIEARTGFQQAIDMAPDNAEFRQGLSRTITAMARLELKRGDDSAAALLLQQLDTPDESLVHELETLQQRQRAALNESLTLREKSFQLDINQDKRIRIFGAIGIFAISLIKVVIYGEPFLQYPFTISHAFGAALISTSILTLIAVVSFAYFRKKRTRLSIHLLRVLWVVAIFHILQCFAMWRLALDVGKMFVPVSISIWMAMGITAALIDARIFLALGIYGLLLIAAVLFPSYAIVLSSLGESIALLLIILTWRPAPNRGQEST